MLDSTKYIKLLRERLGDKVCIVGHHYQEDGVVEHCDITGDSLELARKVAKVTAPHIIFCGVYFMAESAALLARNGQNIYIPDSLANCVMSQMTPAPLLEKVLENLHINSKGKIIPLAYVNTSLAVKDVVGRYGGAVCTSANAKTMLEWALNEAEQVLFLPDKNLARNTARQLGMDETLEHILNVRGGGSQIDYDKVQKSRLLLWPGCCAIHAKFNENIVQDMRKKYPGCAVYVHPECSPQVVGCADGAGSTSYLIDMAAKSPQGSTLIIGTETNLVHRLRMRHMGHCDIIPLRNAYCSHMAKITAPKLLSTLEAIDKGSANALQIPQNQIEYARKSLERMLRVCEVAGV